jgi:hypothetical protein
VFRPPSCLRHCAYKHEPKAFSLRSAPRGAHAFFPAGRGNSCFPLPFTAFSGSSVASLLGLPVQSTGTPLFSSLYASELRLRLGFSAPASTKTGVPVLRVGRGCAPKIKPAAGAAYFHWGENFDFGSPSRQVVARSRSLRGAAWRQHFASFGAKLIQRYASTCGKVSQYRYAGFALFVIHAHTPLPVLIPIVLPQIMI